ncbi:coiled-coil protein (plasmid) [Legionella adelaidensis]|uniref:Coiled-coil protein n=1 Tax=Legionella adelaidensis TaxID=45056 RepID=A0A0W0R0Y1_9GAMM|nr:LbtU family siderophore porin [Legionella adelaidensis]KTC64756.1 coiled-coil protein [Legionella adelaidensis]VEH81313.1 coiled-coil protein [Legionella adelaidensis]
MKHRALIVAMALCSSPLWAATESEQLRKEIEILQKQTQALQTKLTQLQKKLDAKPSPRPTVTKVVRKTETQSKNEAVVSKKTDEPVQSFHTSSITVHAPDAHPESLEFYPTALVADEHVVTYIAGTPVVASPYLGSRPAFDGSDYIVNISSINRDIRLMQQRRRLYRAYESIGYASPHVPIIALSGKVEPIATVNRPYLGKNSGDLNLGSSELDVAAVLNDKVEAYIGIAYDDAPPDDWGQRIANSGFGLNMGFVNIGDLDESPFYLTAGQLYVPFGRFSSAMVSAPLTMRLARTKSRPFILGYKSQHETGPFAAVYGFNSDTTLGSSAAGGVNLGYIFGHNDLTGEIGASVISSIDDSTGMQDTGSQPGTTFGGFASLTNGNEAVRKIPGVGAHYNMSFDRYNFTAEWVGASSRFRAQDLSFNGRGARPQAGQVEGGVTFMAFNRPSSFALGYQWSKQALALNLPAQRISGVFNISIWKDTVESLEYRHDMDYKRSQYANGAEAPDFTNLNTVGTGGTADTLLAQIGVYF